ncbi:putative protein slyX [Cocos nucifera]|uniref:Uncharacterized protein n=1 Tax=Cocos nucifera TaxID=13894 RepID=A0A8K0HVU3_COCNU|nr:putative protein slyX [Cocos nucifera]
MEEAEKILSLKKAYADIILNTAKESAARILASERKALGLQQCLFATKEEAVATLLRLKGIMDSKIREAEMRSSEQTKRVQELEVQLHEAEDVINSLKTELRKVNTTLEQMKDSFSEPLIGQNTNSYATSDNAKCQGDKLASDSKLSPQLGPEDISATDVKYTTSNQRTADDQYCSIGNATEADTLKDLSVENRCASNPDLASIIMRREETELYRNGCTQRIRAFEQNLLTVKVPCGQSDDQVSKNKSKVYEDDKVKRSHTADSAKSAKMVDPERYPTGSGELKFFRRISTRRKRTKYVYLRTTKSATSSDRDMMGHKPLDKVTKSDENLLKAVNEKTALESTKSFKSSEDRKLRTGKAFENETPGLLPCSKRTATGQSVIKEGHLDIKDDILKGKESGPKDLMHEGNVQSPLLSSKTDINNDLTDDLNNDSGSILQVGDSVSTAPDQSVAVNSDVSVCKAEPETGNVSTSNSDPLKENAHESSGLPVLKYTFQRKRKRGSLIGKDEKMLPEKMSSSNSTAEHQITENQSVLVKPQKPTLAMEETRSNRRLVQVARQLISLSLKRW